LEYYFIISTNSISPFPSLKNKSDSYIVNNCYLNRKKILILFFFKFRAPTYFGTTVAVYFISSKGGPARWGVKPTHKKACFSCAQAGEQAFLVG
jgi:hypothetical protein